MDGAASIQKIPKPIPSVSTMPKLTAPLKSVLKTPSSQAAFLMRSGMNISSQNSLDHEHISTPVKKKEVSFGGSEIKNY